MALRAAFEAVEDDERSGRANDGVKGEVSATDAGEPINLKNALEQVCSYGQLWSLRAWGGFQADLSCTPSSLPGLRLMPPHWSTTRPESISNQGRVSVPFWAR
ncbi:MAG: hypothetical protein GWP91_01965 [Rhodobacterales bacterium]|nr:hypothetical protein [Rhodobacterales bacterium]